MKNKKLLTIVTVLIILFAQCGIINFFNSSKVFALNVNTTEWNRYFYDQLQPNAKAIYNAMFKMYKEGLFIKGESLEITNEISASSIALFVNGSNDLINDYGAARDAFQYDYPDCFFVDWDELSIRVTQDTSGALHAFLGAGRSDTYLLKGMNKNRTSKANGGKGTGIEGAITEYEALITEVVNKIKADASDITDETEKMVKMAGDAHDYVTQHMSYKHEWETIAPDPTESNMRSTSRTSYDGLKYGEGVCEAYTRTFKAICDRLDIPCICVYGLYSPKSTINEPHIWNYLLIGGKWYGVDVTHDDPTVLNGMFEHNTNENRDYFLVGQNQLSAHHFPQGIVSSANFEFKYPTLEADKYRESYSVETGDGFSILVEKDTDFDNWNGNTPFDSGTFYVSYEGMNYTQNAARGKYIVAKYYTYEPGTDTWNISDWSYIDPWIVHFGQYEDRFEEIEPSQPKGGIVDGEGNTVEEGKYCTILPLGQAKAVQFAITEAPPAYNEIKFQAEQFTKKGEKIPENIVAQIQEALYVKEAAFLNDGSVLNVSTTKIENKWGDYVSPPIPTKTSPEGCLYIGYTHHLKIQFNDKLKLKTPDSEVKISMTVDGGAGIAGNWNAGHTALENAKIANIKWDENNTVEFDFTPSDMFADNSIFYNFQVEGLIGNSSNKAPVAATYGFRFPKACFAYAAQGYNRNVYAQPQLMETTDMDMSSWELQDADGKKETMSEYMDEIAEDRQQDFLDSLHERLTLVTTETTSSQETQMEEILKAKKSEDYSDVVSGTMNTYNISITVCKKQVLHTGESVRIALGFPKGTTYEDYAESGRLSFKAYHYIVDPDTNKLTGEVEEIPVTVTRQGLVLWVKSFSPFTVMAVKNEEETAIKQKELLVASSLGGSVQDESGKVLDRTSANIKLTEGQSKKVTISANEGYEIDSIMVDGVRQKIIDKKSQEFDISYDKINTGDVLSVNFVAEEIHEEEAKQDLSSDFNVPNLIITLDKTNYEFVEGDNVKISPTVTVTGGDFNPTLSEEEAIADSTHPDYIKYEWTKETGGRPWPYKVVAKTNDLVFESVEGNEEKNGVQISDKGKYLFQVTLMRWNDNEQAYKPLQIGGRKFSEYYNGTIIISKVYNKIDIDLKQEEGITGSKDEGYNLILGVGGRKKLTAEVYRLNGEQKETDGSVVTWTSSDPDYVSVDKSGELTVNKYTDKDVTITATVTDRINGATKQVKVTVKITQLPVSSIELYNDEDNKVTEMTLEVDGNKNHNEHSGEEILTAKVLPDEVINTEITWTVTSGGDYVELIKKSNNVVSVKAKKIGEATIEAKAGDQTATCKIHVVKTPVTGLSDEFEKDEINLVAPRAGENAEDKSVTIAVNVLPENATNKTLEWESSDSNQSVIKLTHKDGVATITPVAAGNCTVTVKSADDPNISITYNVIVSNNIVAVTNVAILREDGKDTNLNVGEELQLKAHILPEGADVKDVTWSLESGSGVINLNSTGDVTAIAAGTAKVKVIVKCQEDNCQGHTAEITLNVNKVLPENITLDKTELNLRAGESEKLTAVVTPLNVTDKTIIWNSDNTDVASVDSDGNITAKEKGTAIITAKCGEKTATCTVNVTPIKVERLLISEDYLKIKDKLAEGEQVKLIVTCEPENSEIVKLKWESSNPEVVTVDEKGIITPVAPGDATITVSVDQDGYDENEVAPAKCDVTVVPSETNLVIYTTDQNGKFLPGFTLRLMKTDHTTGEMQEVNVISGDGKFDFGMLQDGEYTVYITEVGKEDFEKNELNVIDILESYQFEIIDGEIILTSGEEGYADSIILKSIVDYPNEDETGLTAYATHSEENTEELYQEFIKTKPVEPDDSGESNPPINPDNPDTQDNPDTPDAPDNPDVQGNPDTQEPEKELGEDNLYKGENNNTLKNKLLPDTSDISIEVYIMLMIGSLVGIIFIVRKKNKK